MVDDKKHHIRDTQIYNLTTLVAGKFSLQEVLDRLTEAAVKITAVKACSIRLLDEQGLKLEMRSTFGLSEQYRQKGEVSRNDTVVRSAFDGEAVVVDDMRLDDRVKYKKAATKEGIVSQLTVRMEFRDKPTGVLRLYSTRPKHFSNDDIALARAVASQCAVAIHNAKLYAEAIEGQRIAEQMRLAGAIQRRMIPEKAPRIIGLDIEATYIPCFDVGGDFFDFLPIGENSVALVMADVIGKGIPAAIMMSCFRGSVRAYADGARTSEAITKLIAKLNKTACSECRQGEFITFFYAVLDGRQNTITYCNCGHVPPVLLRDRKTSELNAGGLVLGVKSETSYEVEKLALQDGDSILLCTDGLSDAENFDGELWGKERMLATAKKCADGTAGQMIKKLLGYRRRFTGLARQTDDTSIIVVKVDKTVS